VYNELVIPFLQTRSVFDRFICTIQRGEKITVDPLPQDSIHRNEMAKPRPGFDYYRLGLPHALTPRDVIRYYALEWEPIAY